MYILPRGAMAFSTNRVHHRLAISICAGLQLSNYMEHIAGILQSIIMTRLTTNQSPFFFFPSLFRSRSVTHATC